MPSQSKKVSRAAASHGSSKSLSATKESKKSSLKSSSSSKLQRRGNGIDTSWVKKLPAKIKQQSESRLETSGSTKHRKPSSDLATKKKQKVSYSFKSAPIKKHKTMVATIHELEKNSDKLDTKLKGREQWAFQIGKSKSNATFATMKQLINHLSKYKSIVDRLNSRGKKYDQLVKAIKIVKWNGTQGEWVKEKKKQSAEGNARKKKLKQEKTALKKQIVGLKKELKKERVEKRKNRKR